MNDDIYKMIADLARRVELLETSDRYGDPTPAATLTIAGGAVTISTLPLATVRFRFVDTESAAATDDLDTITGGIAGDILILSTVSASRDVTVKDGTGNLFIAGDFTLTNNLDMIMLIKKNAAGGGSWGEVSRSDNQ